MVSASNITDEILEIDYTLNDEDSISNDVEQLSISEENQLEDTYKPIGNTFNDIQTAVDNSKSGDIIDLEGEYVSYGNSIIINKDLTIQGSNNTVLKANGGSKCFQLISYSKIVFKNLKIVDANQAIVSDYSSEFSYKNITCINCTFINNAHIESRWDEGGAIETHNSLTIIDCNFINCSSSFGGGAVYCNDGFFSGSNFINNSIRNYSQFNHNYGGAIFGNELTVVGCNFFNNSADRGGAIFCEQYELNITNCKFINNHAKAFGGAVCTYSKFAPNSGYQFAIANSEFLNNSADYLDTDLVESYKMDYLDFGSGSFSTYHHTYTQLKYLISNCSGLYVTHLTSVIITAPKLTASYNSGKIFKFTITDKKTKKAMKNFPICVKITVPKKLYSSWRKLEKNFDFDTCLQESAKYWVICTTIYTNSKGIASLKFNHAVGSYKIEVFPSYVNYSATKISSTIKINKASTIIKAPKITVKYKKSKYFKVTVKNKATKKVVKNIKVKIKVFTGKKYKIYTVKTNKKGVAKINTKKLRRGTHKVVITSGNSKYKISAKSTIKIK